MASGALCALLAFYFLVFNSNYIDELTPTAKTDNQPERGDTFIRHTVIWSMIYLFSFSFAMTAMQIYAPAYFNPSRGLTLIEAGYALTAFLISFAIGTNLGGFTKAIQNGKEGLTIACFMALWAGLNAITMMAENIALSISLFIVGGLFGGVCSPIRDLLNRNGVKNGSAGKAFGHVYSGWDIGYSMVPVVIAVVYQRFGPEPAIALGISAIAICGVVAQVIAIETRN